MANETAIVNSALVKIGSNDRITSLSENSVQARSANAIYDLKRDQCLRDHTWKFALKRTILASLVDTPAFEYTAQFSLPTDCLRVVQVGAEPYSSGDFRYKIEGRKILADDTSLPLVYVARIEDPQQYDAMFVEAFALLLAAELAIPLAQSSTLQQSLLQQYEKAIRTARTVDAQENPPQVIFAETFINSRY